MDKFSELEINYHDKLQTEIKASMDMKGHPITDIIEVFKNTLIEEINHFTSKVVDYNAKLTKQN